jgi:hypothetical protein
MTLTPAVEAQAGEPGLPLWERLRRLVMNSAALPPGEHAIDAVVPDRAEEYACGPSYIPRNSAPDERTGEGDIDDRTKGTGSVEL